MLIKSKAYLQYEHMLKDRSQYLTFLVILYTSCKELYYIGETTLHSYGTPVQSVFGIEPPACLCRYSIAMLSLLLLPHQTIFRHHTDPRLVAERLRYDFITSTLLLDWERFLFIVPVSIAAGSAVPPLVSSKPAAFGPFDGCDALLPSFIR